HHRRAAWRHPVLHGIRRPALPPAPPAFCSAAFNAALAEVRQIADTRTAEQIEIANYWNVNASPVSNAAAIGVALELIVEKRKKEPEAARILFLMAAASPINPPPPPASSLPHP